jgi:curved DNA-binding protein CbpA
MNYNKACKILNISKDELTIDTLKKQYRLNALLFHPDKNKSEDASEKFQDVQNAYEYLLKHINMDINSDIFQEDNTYISILADFLKNVMKNDVQHQIFYTIIQKISTTCEEKALKTLEKIDKKLLIKIYELLNSQREVLHFSNDFLVKIKDLLNNKIKNDECIILNPIISDLFENNVYKLKVRDFTYVVPLWHHELVYDNSGNDIYVKCIPIINDDVEIDDKNNIIIDLKYTIQDLWNKDNVEFKIGERCFYFSPSQLKIKKTQTIVLKEQGISKINTVEIYDITQKSDIILHLEIT